MDGTRREVVGLPRPRPPAQTADRPPAEPADQPPAEPVQQADPAEQAGAERTDPAGQAELTDRERGVLDFERHWWKHAGAKEQAIRDRFGLSATRYYQVLNGLLDRQAALAYDPVLVKRLRRLRATRTRARRTGPGAGPDHPGRVTPGPDG